MTAEAAMLGIPTISCYPVEPTIVEKYLIKKNLVLRITDSDKVIKRINSLLSDFDNFHRIQQNRAQEFLSTMEDPIDVIIKTIEDNFVST